MREPSYTHIVSPGDIVVHIDEIIEKLLDGGTINGIAREYSIPTMTLYRAVRKNGWNWVGANNGKWVKE